MLVHAGIRVACTDLDENRLQLAKELGAELVINPKNEDTVRQITNWTGGYGADAVIFTAATQSSEPLSDAFKMCRRKGRVVLVGVSGMNIQRQDIYPKEIDFLISTSYGPGRYDNNYELKGIDYPYAYVRWTENRNLTEYLRLLNEKEIKLEKIIQKIFPVSEVTEAFNAYKDSSQKPLMVILDYGEPDLRQMTDYLNHDRKIHLQINPVNKKLVNLAMVGVGNFATNVHLPNIEVLKDKFQVHAVMNRSGYKATHVARQTGASYSTTNYKDVLEDENVDLVFISTRHDSHGKLVLEALEAGKHVFVEKPLAVTSQELEAIEAFYQTPAENKPLLMVGFNRRFSKYAEEIKKHTDKRINPLFIQYRMNAGYIPADHWVHESGGRIVGEACHIIDLMTYFTGSALESVSFEELTPSTGNFNSSDNKSIILKYKDGSVANIHYFAVGSKQLPKEYMEIHFDEKSIVMEDYKWLKGYGIKLQELKSQTSEKGHQQELEMLHTALTAPESNWPIELWDMVQTTNVSLMITKR